MKKISTLFLAMMMGISLMAVPHKNHVGEKIIPVSSELVELTSPVEIITKRLSDVSFAERKFLPTSSAKTNSTDTIVPEPEIFKTIVFEAPSYSTYNTLNKPYTFYMFNENKDYQVSIVVYDSALDKEFTMDDVESQYTGILDNNEEVEFTTLTGKIYQVGDTTKMQVVALGTNAVQYTLEMWYAVPTPIDTVEITIEDAELVDYFNEYGLFLAYGYSEDADYFASLALYGDEVAGTYVNDGKFGSFGAEGGNCDMYGPNCYITKVIDHHNNNKIQIQKGTVEVTMEEQEGYFLVTTVADVVCSDSICYLITLKSIYEPYNEYDVQEGVEKIFTASDRRAIQYSPEGKFAYVDLISSDVSEFATFMFFVEEFDEEIVIPEGTYKINGLCQPGTVQEGFMSNGAIFPSFYSQITKDGYIIVPLWFIIDGTVTIERVGDNFKLEANAFNTYGYPVHIVYDPTITAVDNVEVHTNGTVKRIIDSQLIILHNGDMYNVMGMEIGE